jgi:hypothetical protein
VTNDENLDEESEREGNSDKINKKINSEQWER